jgi:hypothetical protein
LVESDLLIGADGINSFVAKEVLKDNDDPVFCGENIFYGLIENQKEGRNVDSLFGTYNLGEFICFPVGKMQILLSGH